MVIEIISFWNHPQVTLHVLGWPLFLLTEQQYLSSSPWCREPCTWGSGRCWMCREPPPTCLLSAHTHAPGCQCSGTEIWNTYFIICVLSWANQQPIERNDFLWKSFRSMCEKLIIIISDFIVFVVKAFVFYSLKTYIKTVCVNCYIKALGSNDKRWQDTNLNLMTITFNNKKYQNYKNSYVLLI